MEELKVKIRSIVRDAVNVAGVDIELSDDISLIESGLLDSLSIVYVVQGLQDHFEIDLDFADVTLENFDSIDVIALFVSERHQGNE